MKILDLKRRVLSSLKKVIQTDKTMILGISGGPDSMLLLELLKDQKIVVCHVNYNKRTNSMDDELIVKKYCEINQIPFFVKSIKKHHNKGNFQTIARNQRYDFFNKIANKFHTDILVLAHHKDDFLETAIMLEQTKRKTNFYGIKKNNTVFNLFVFRPFINLVWKKQILNINQLNKIPYGLDYTNYENIYTRNIIRNALLKESLYDKGLLLKRYLKMNKKLILEQQKINETLLLWKSQNYAQEFLLDQKDIATSLIFELINQNFDHVNLTSGKLENIYKFIISNNRTSVYKLDNNYCLIKKRGCLIL
ncbi:tRNA lysidine(34) synthetase TilS [[Mycoplasma] anseris]|uniref:tRNA(Ile)-lysidine synthase n=1 Tax=[Mycoplasma] anseris TaxID=92400 RepID=A0A2Z4ND60_9BACT|nr:tRNA lysidine(34) synthetase TilS [[Mycoplasma] anseris]AWX69489.1 tRNA lysidine(34) synthetase TilS [[Mycoplasma] anseris]